MGLLINKGLNLQKRILFIFTLLFLFQITWAQSEGNGPKDPRYIIDPETGKLSMVIRVWGEVIRPGVTMVPSDADLISLISYVGGPTSRAKLNDIRIIRFNQNEGEERILHANIEAFLETGDDKYIPVVYPNDTIIISGTFWKTLSGFAPYVSLAVSVLNVYVLYQRL